MRSGEPPVLRVLGAVCRAGLGVPPSIDGDVDAADLRLDDDAWLELMHRCASNRITGLLGAAVETGLVAASEAQYDVLRERLRDDLAGVLVIEQHLLRVLDLFRTVGIDVRALKGPAVAHLDYPDPSMRLFSDVDILVRPEQFDEAVRTIVGTGVDRRFPELRKGFDRRFTKGVEFYADGEPEIDLHRTFVMGPYGLRIDLDEVWRTSETFHLADVEVHALDVDVRFLHACYHVALGGVPVRLAQLRDIPELLFGGRVDLARCFDLVRSWRGEAVLARAGVLAWDHLGLAEGEFSTWARRCQISANDRRALQSYLDPEMGYAARCLTAVGSVPGVRGKIAFGVGLAFPSAEFGSGRHAGHGSRWRRALQDLRRLTVPPVTDTKRSEGG